MLGRDVFIFETLGFLLCPVQSEFHPWGDEDLTGSAEIVETRRDVRIGL